MKVLWTTLFGAFMLGACTDGSDAISTPVDVLSQITSEQRPTKRSEVHGAWHEATNTLMMFGGNDGPVVNQFPSPTFRNDTWVFEPGFGWSELDVQGPSKRGRYAVVVDEQADRALLFGGRFRRANASGDYTLFNDLWSFDFVSRTWTLLDDGEGAGPEPRYYANGVWDAENEALTIWGGNLNTDPLQFEVTDEIWRWDSSGWTDLSDQQSGTPPSDRSFLGAAHDSTRKRLVVFGGQIGNLSDLAYQDTYALDLETLEWTLLHDGSGRSPATRMHGRLVHDVAEDRYLLFGGHTDRGDQNDLWSFDPTDDTWSKLYMADKFTGEAFGCIGNASEVPSDYVSMDLSAPERRHNGLYIKALDNLWIFGGIHAECSDHLDDTWRFDLMTESWHEVIPARTGESCARRGDDCECLCL